MKIHLQLFFWIILFSGINSLLMAQPDKIQSAGEITFNDNLVNRGFNRVYLLQPHESVKIKNFSSEEIAIGLKDYFDISNKLALIYQSRDSLSVKIITEYENIDRTMGNVSSGIKMISDSLRKVNLQPSINLLGKSNETLENSNKQLDSAIVKLNEINSDLNKIQLKNILSTLIIGIAGFIAGALIF